MTTVPRQLAIFFGVLLVLYAAGYALGSIIDAEAPGGHGEQHEAGEPRATHSPSHGAPSTTGHGLRLSIDAAGIRAGRPHDLRLAVRDQSDMLVTDYDTTHTKKMHLIAFRNDLTGFQHLHPTRDEAGFWRARTTFRSGGRHRVVADFSHEGEKVTLAGDVEVAGPGSSRPLPPSAPLARTTGGYTVRIDADATRPGEETTLSFAVHDRDGRAVRPQPYLGAGGHLVALREGDLEYLHVHPEGDASGAVAFATTFPTPGRYRLFLQFRHDGRVRTAAFTHEVR